MTDLAPKLVAAAERHFGTPSLLTASHEITAAELMPIRRSERKGRHHDVTLYIFAADDVALGKSLAPARLAVIAKSSYPAGGYRPPGGGVHPGETIEQGARREALEETGLHVALTRYLVRSTVRFTCGEDYADWTTHVFAAVAAQHPLPDRLQPLDTDEISEARWVSLTELQSEVREVLLRSGRGLFAYRVALHDAVYDHLHRHGVWFHPVEEEE